MFLYFDEGIVTGAYIRQLDEVVNKVKDSEERRHEYMVMMIREMEAKEEGKTEECLKGYLNIHWWLRNAGNIKIFIETNDSVGIMLFEAE